jgi:hypothetical protein
VLIAEAEKAAQAGDYAEAETQYQAALDLGGKLAKLEQTESVEQSTLNVSVEAQLSSVSTKKSKKLGKKGKNQLDTKFKSESTRFGSFNGGGGGSTASDDGKRTGDEHEPVIAGQAGILDPVGNVDTANVAAVGGVPATISAPEDIEGILDPSAGLNTRAAPSPSGTPGSDMPAVEPNIDVPDPQDAPALSSGEATPGPVMPAPTPASDESGGEDIDTDAIAHVLQAEPDVPRMRQRMLARRGIKSKSAGPTRGRASRRQAQAVTTADAGVAVYDFEDDNVDGEVLRPEGAMLASRSAPSTPIERLPAPKVTASALSVIVPVTGQTVRYQQLLIEANQTQVIEIDARRRLRR